MNRAACAATGLALLLAACAAPAPAPPPPELAARLTPNWLAEAKRIRTGERVIYFRGSAHPPSHSRAAAWSGTVSGDILVLDAESALIVTGGAVTLSPAGALSVAGTSQIITSESPAWKDLLAP